MRKLNFGCGRDIKKGWDNCDKQEGKGIITFNADKFPYPFKDNTYDYILLDPNGPKKGKYYRRWRVRINISTDEIKASKLG